MLEIREAGPNITNRILIDRHALRTFQGRREYGQGAEIAYPRYGQCEVLHASGYMHFWGDGVRRRVWDSVLEHDAEMFKGVQLGLTGRTQMGYTQG